jgi:hypothetical protein
MTCHMTWLATPSVQQLPGDLRLLLELRSPVLEALQHQAVRFAILSLVLRSLRRHASWCERQNASRSGQYPSSSTCPLILSSPAYFAVEVRSQSAFARQVCEEWTLTLDR